MDPCYAIADTRQIITPALIVFRDLVGENLQRMIAIAGGPDRLRPHCKTHKIREIAAWELSLGIGKHKCATLAEAEMLAQAGVQDALLAYQPVGPNIARVVRFLEVYPQVRLAVCVDHAEVIAQLGTAVSAGGRELDVLLDLDLGLQRTGVPPGPAAVDLYRQIVRTRGLRPAGLHAYDGHLHQSSYEERAAAVRQAWTGVAQLRDELRREGCPVPKIVAGGTGTFPVYAAMPDPELELSPGTPIFYDAGYRETFPDLPFQVAAMLLTRVVSRPAADLVTFDLGYKACASDPPAGRRLVFPEIPDAREVRQNEEHLVIQTSLAERFRPGDEQLAIPRHICPTVALHRRVQVVSGGRVIGCWEVAARDRLLSL